MHGLKIRKKCILGKVAFYELPCIFFLIFNISGKSIKQELLEMVQVTVPILFILMKTEIEGIRAFLHAFFYMHILYIIPVKNACKKALSSSDFIKIKKNLEQ